MKLKEFFQWISIYSPLFLPWTFYPVIYMSTQLSTPQFFHLFLMHFNVNCFPLKSVSWLELTRVRHLFTTFLFGVKFICHEMKNLTCMFAESWQMCMSVWPKPCQDTDPSHHSRKFLHVYSQSVLTHTLPESTTAVMFWCFFQVDYICLF